MHACVAGSTLTPDDARWIGCWWLGYIVVAVGLLATSVPLWFFPSSMVARPRQTSSAPHQDGVRTHAHNSSGGGGKHKSIGRKLWKEVKGNYYFASPPLPGGGLV